MSGETADAPLGWTPDLLRIHIERVLAEMDHRYEQRFVGQESALMAALAAVKEATAKAEMERKKWESNSNEWRGAMQDREAMFLPRPEYAASHANMAEKVDDLARRTTASFASIGSRLDLMTGRAAGSTEAVTHRRQGQAAVYAAIAIGITILSFLMALGAYVAAKP